MRDLEQEARRLISQFGGSRSKKLWQRYKRHLPFIGVRMGALANVKPVNGKWGFNRGKPIDRYYIENFLSNHSGDIEGNVLSIGDDYYALLYSEDRLNLQSDILHVSDKENATIVADLSNENSIGSHCFDCFLFIQTLQLIYDIHQAVSTTYRILKPGGVVLATFPGITPLKDDEWNDSWYWNFTSQSAQRLFEESFPKENVHVQAYGNVVAATAFLHGLSIEDVGIEKLDFVDPGFPVTIVVRAEKPH